MKKVSEFGWKQSFSYVGRPGDTAWSQSLFSVLKKEIVHWRFYPTRESAREAIFEYIEVFYNRRLIQKRLAAKVLLRSSRPGNNCIYKVLLCKSSENR